MGAGPSRLAAAITLARAGLETQIFERRACAGFRHHGFQGMENWSHAGNAADVLRAIGIEPDFLLRPVHEMAYYGPKRREHLVTWGKRALTALRSALEPSMTNSIGVCGSSPGSTWGSKSVPMLAALSSVSEKEDEA